MESYMDRIVVDQDIMVGKPVIKGTRIPVDAILQRIADGFSIEDILEEYPNLTKEDVKAAIMYSTQIVKSENIIPVIQN